ncbi:MAG TPA: hypothetical protein VME18_04085 [Acidobacteriaceae bacterium]|nr:hypothetical protein [Acidobacteriaceae bacterium]
MRRRRPKEPVIVAYRQRAEKTNQHVKSSIRPWRAAQCRNSHSWFYFPVGVPVDEHGRPLYGSLRMDPTAEVAWISHYYARSEEDYPKKVA